MTTATVPMDLMNRERALVRIAVSPSTARMRGIYLAQSGLVGSMMEFVVRPGDSPGVDLNAELMIDPECCDGSDEWQSGACPNSCAEIGREHRARIEAETKTRKTVSI